jgi:hypothetical protein
VRNRPIGVHMTFHLETPSPKLASARPRVGRASGAQVSLRTLGLEVVACIFALAFVDDASATCGDWLAEHPAPPQAQLESEGVPEPVRQRRPCQGPQCREAPSIPTPATPTPTRIAQDELRAFTSLSAVDSDSPRVSSLELAGAVQALPGYRQRVDHPPRV